MARLGQRGRRKPFSAVALLCALALVVSACGGDDDSGGGGGGGDDGSTTTAAAEGEPQRGGKVVYALEAETTGGFCLQESQLAIAGIQVARTIYDTLAVPNEDGEYVPWLAESWEPNATYDEWTIKLRPGVKFHDGTDLTAEVVKNNIDAYRGAYEARKPLLFIFVYQNVKEVTVVDDLTVKVTTVTPWTAFPAYLYANGRAGMTAQAQLDDATSCDKNMIGTGPFMLEEWKVNEKLVAKANPDYWFMGEDGKPLPYLDEIEYRPIADGPQRLNALQGGQINVMHTSGALTIDELRGLAEAGQIQLVESDKYPETGYAMLNTSKPPFDNILARQAMAHAVNRDEFNQIRNKGILTNASGPFGPGNMGYLDDAGYPEYDPDKAAELVAQYEEEAGQPLEFTLSSTPDPDTIATAQLVKEYAEKVGAKVTLRQSEQAQLINEAIGGEFQAVLWRNHPGGDPDTQYVWWHSGSPVNFGRIEDTEVDRLLDEGRSESDPAKREQIYQDLNRRFAEGLFNLWAQWTVWAIGYANDVHGVGGPDLPDGSKPFPGLGNGHSVAGLWVGE